MRANANLTLPVDALNKLDSLAKSTGKFRNEVVERLIYKEFDAANEQGIIELPINSEGNNEIVVPKTDVVPKSNFDDDYSDKLNAFKDKTKHEFKVLGFIPKLFEWEKKMEKNHYPPKERRQVYLRLMMEAMIFSKSKSVGNIASDYPLQVLGALNSFERASSLACTSMEKIEQLYADLVGE